MRVKVHLFKGSGLIGWIIRRRTWGKYAHAAVEVDGVLYEALEAPFPKGKVKKTDINRKWPEKRQKPSLTLLTDLTDEEADNLKMFLENAVGAKYDYWGVLSFLSRGSERPWSKSKWFCSELVCAAFHDIDKPLFHRKPCYKVSPSDIAHSLRFIGAMENFY